MTPNGRNEQRSAPKCSWQKPELRELPVAGSESGLNVIGEISILTAPLLS